MAYDAGLAQIFIDDLADEIGVVEKRMFGGLCFMNKGHMLCGVHHKDGQDGVMFRVGPASYDKALAMDGVDELTFTGRPMKGLVECFAAVVADEDTVRMALLKLALDFTNGLPPKKPKTPK